MRHGFTVIEMVLALALSAILAISAMSVMWVLSASDERLAKRADDDAEFVITQMVVRRAMGSLIASKPRDAASERAAGSNEKNGENGDEAGVQGADDLADLITSVTGDAALADELTSGENADRPNFELYFEEIGGLTLPALEVKVMESPVPPPTTSDAEPDELLGVEQFLPVRGVFESFQLDQGLALQWRPIDPPGPPTLLIKNLAAIEWYCLPHKEDWVDVYAAYIKKSFPAGVRLVMWTLNGSQVDWFFDTAITTPEAQ